MSEWWRLLTPATTVIAFTYEADIHCVGCAHARFPDGPHRATDAEGNDVHPVFASDEGADEVCGTCGGPIR